MATEVTSAHASAQVTETRAGKFQDEVQAGGISFLADEPAGLGGLGTGPSPYDLLCAALGACTSMTVRLYADQKGWPLTRISVKVGNTPKTATTKDKFLREITFEGALDETQRARLMQIAERCPVHRTLSEGSEIETHMAG